VEELERLAYHGVRRRRAAGVVGLVKTDGS